MRDGNGVGVGDLFAALSTECATLAVISERIQTIVVSASAYAPTRPSFHAHAQACDLLTQSLIAITHFLSEAAQRIPHDWTVDVAEAVEKVPLSDLAAALAMLPKPSNGTDENVIELF